MNYTPEQTQIILAMKDMFETPQTWTIDHFTQKLKDIEAMPGADKLDISLPGLSFREFTKPFTGEARLDVVVSFL